MIFANTPAMLKEAFEKNGSKTNARKMADFGLAYEFVSHLNTTFRAETNYTVM